MVSRARVALSVILTLMLPVTKEPRCCQVGSSVGNGCVSKSAAAVIAINGGQLSDGGRIRDGDIFASSNVGTGVGGEVAGGVRNGGVGERAVAVVGINAA